MCRNLIRCEFPLLDDERDLIDADVLLPIVGFSLLDFRDLEVWRVVTVWASVLFARVPSVLVGRNVGSKVAITYVVKIENVRSTCAVKCFVGSVGSGKWKVCVVCVIFLFFAIGHELCEVVLLSYGLGAHNL